MGQWRPVCRVDEVPEGEARMFVVQDERLAIFRIAGQFYALDDQCPHAGASLARGIVEKDTVRCRIHHWRFRIADGEYLDEPQPSHNARSYPVRVDGDQLLVEL